MTNGEPIGALKDSSFAIKRGEVDGSSERNGAGTSTPLKIPSASSSRQSDAYSFMGSGVRNGKSGAGFHSELTRRESNYLNGAVLRMKRAEIVVSAQIERFSDTALKHKAGGIRMRLPQWLKGSAFMLSYADGVCDVDLLALARLHPPHNRLACFGGLIVAGVLRAVFSAKPQAGEGRINAGFRVFEQLIFECVEGDQSSLGGAALERSAADRQLVAYGHGYSRPCMDMLRHKQLREAVWHEPCVSRKARA